MEPDFKTACVAIKPYFNTFAAKFIEDLQQGVFAGDEANFIEAKHQVKIIECMKQTLLNETCEGE